MCRYDGVRTLLIVAAATAVITALRRPRTAPTVVTVPAQRASVLGLELEDDAMLAEQAARDDRMFAALDWS